MNVNQRTEELLAPAASDCVSGVRLKRSEETFIINRRGRSTHPEKKSVLRSGATPEKLYLQVFAPPETQTPRRAAGAR